MTNLKKSIFASFENLIIPKNLIHLLDNFKKLEIIENCIYDLVLILSSITGTNLDISTIENFANFINLYGELIEQDEINSKLQVYADNELIKEDIATQFRVDKSDLVRHIYKLCAILQKNSQI